MTSPYGTGTYFTDEMRYGTRTHSRRRWSRQGRRPRCSLRLGYELAYLYVALCPFTGDVFAMLLPHPDKAGFWVFQMGLYLKEKEVGRILLIGDGAHCPAVGEARAGLAEAARRLSGAEPGGALL